MDLTRKTAGTWLNRKTGNDRNFKSNLKSGFTKVILTLTVCLQIQALTVPSTNTPGLPLRRYRPSGHWGKKYWKPIIMIAWGTSLLCITTRKDYIPYATICLEN